MQHVIIIGPVVFRGYFHKWFLEYTKLGSRVIGIVEDLDGICHVVDIDKIRFCSVEQSIEALSDSLGKPIRDLELTVRTENCLANANIKTVYELTQYTEKELLKIKNFGRSCLREIKTILMPMGLSLKPMDRR
jgi:DNA-directed RNA polymerase alpha subunit